jgi:hypothetical protein
LALALPLSWFTARASRHAQLRYEIAVASTELALSLNRVGFETALGAGFGDWNFIVKESVEDSMLLLSEFVRYASELPNRLLGLQTTTRREY